MTNRSQPGFIFRRRSDRPILFDDTDSCTIPEAPFVSRCSLCTRTYRGLAGEFCRACEKHFKNRIRKRGRIYVIRRVFKFINMR